MTLIFTLLIIGAFIVNPILGVLVTLGLILLRAVAKDILATMPQSEPHISQLTENFDYFIVGPRHKPLGAVIPIYERGVWLLVKFDV